VFFFFFFWWGGLYPPALWEYSQGSASLFVELAFTTEEPELNVDMDSEKPKCTEVGVGEHGRPGSLSGFLS
jgi:hypothetical protein